ncbi:MAG TPA: HAMP domain-containing sensor histidine kinase [Mesorhizobium sp.]
MAQRRSTTTDKFIVDRRKAHLDRGVARTVRQTREKLSQTAGNPGFERELLILHAHAIVASTLPIGLLVLSATCISAFVGMGLPVIIWCAATLAAYTGLAVYAKLVERSNILELRTATARRNLLIGHAATGLAWIYFAYIGCDACAIAEYAIIKAVVLLIAMAATAVITSHLPGALLLTFAGAALAYLISIGVNAAPLEVVMGLLITISLAFFVYIASRMNRSTLLVILFRSEKDGLIAELETAKSMSDEARRRAEEANLAKSRFLASMSHELRTPLNAILGFSEVMANEVLGPMSSSIYREYAQDIHGSGKHLLDLINEILDLSRIEAGRYQLNEEPISLLDTVEECCHLVELRARGKNIRITQQFEQRLPRLLADERAVRQIVLNLMANALKFTPTGGEVRVRVGWTAGGGQYIAIKDNGPGIPADEIPVVLSAFGQGSIAIKSAEQGTGLGLPIVQGLISMHGGQFELTSKLREGTEVIAIFPASRVMEPTPVVVKNDRIELHAKAS